MTPAKLVPIPIFAALVSDLPQTIERPLPTDRPSVAFFSPANTVTKSMRPTRGRIILPQTKRPAIPKSRPSAAAPFSPSTVFAIPMAEPEGCHD